jgi:hypothetical protein
MLTALTMAGCGPGQLTGAPDPTDASIEVGATSDAGAMSTLDMAGTDAGSADCAERTALVLGCVVPEVSCLSTNPCPATWSEAEATCPLDGTMVLAITCGFNRWDFGPNDPQQASVSCFFDPATGALSAIREVVPLQDRYCNNTSYQRWTGPELENCDLSSQGNPVAMVCPRSVPLGACPSGAANGIGCLSGSAECVRADGSTCACNGSLQYDGYVWQCVGP